VSEENPQDAVKVPSKLFLPAGIALLLISWYFLDPIVSFTADASMAPKWLIWFLVLATLTSWPEFKSVLSLLKKWKVLDGFINIFVSNITNIWLASIWILVWLVIELLK
jgi:cation:H+ antiporter